MNLVLAAVTADLFQAAMTTNKKKFNFLMQRGFCTVLLFIPLIVAGGRLVTRVVMNLWNMLES
jgi:hypothetical protein